MEVATSLPPSDDASWKGRLRQVFDGRAKFCESLRHLRQKLIDVATVLPDPEAEEDDSSGEDFADTAENGFVSSTAESGRLH